MFFKRIMLFCIVYILSLSPSFSQHLWGALAFSKSTGIPGGSLDQASQSDAERAAMAACVRKHKGKRNDCRILTPLYNGCAAVYWSPRDKHGGYGTSAGSVKQAEARANSACIDQGGAQCQYRMSFCTTLIFN